MKKLEVEFVLNADKRGDNTFRQIKRTDNVAMYRRFDMEGRGLEWEVFVVKVAGGKEIFGRHYDKYEQYPGASAFGKHAYSLASEEAAERIFEELVKTGGKRPKEKRIVKKKGNGQRGRPKAKRPEIKLPKKRFCMKDLVKLNTKGWTQPTLYLELKRLMKTRKVQEVARESKGRGRATVFYKVKA